MTAKSKNNGKLRVLVVGVGNMGASHAHAYDEIDGFELAGLCARHIAKRTDLPQPESFYYWEFIEQNGPGLVAVRKPEGEPFAVSLYAAINPADVTVYRGK